MEKPSSKQKREVEKRVKEVRADEIRRLNGEIYELQEERKRIIEATYLDSPECEANWARIAEVAAQVKFWEDLPLLNRARKLSIEIPDDKATEPFGDGRKGVTYTGEIWLRRELRRHRDSRLEFYGKLVMPAIALIISIIALFIKASSPHCPVQ